ncbi:MAG: S8 family serine peptidase [Flammeovirgaceae bacterium]|nr:S8 family serine peptidase [Flammeovirgaceae bacterium]
MRVITFLFIAVAFGFSGNVLAQENQFAVFFKDKKGASFSLDQPEQFLSEKSLQRRLKQGIELDEKDLPVSYAYLNELKANDAKIIYTSKWLNGALIEVVDTSAKDKIKQLPFLRTPSFPLGTLELNEVNEIAEELNYGNSFAQNEMLGVDLMHELGYNGEGITIAIVDGGFNNANEIAAFDRLFQKEKIKGTFDFVELEENVYDDHKHGLQVFSAMAAYVPGELIGPAYNADYFLFRTEDTGTEVRIEEFYWAVAAEYADSAGVDILSSSVGYNLFDDPNDDYVQEDLNGEKAMITQVADIAAGRGILVVVSAGNEGNDPWKSIIFPADADSVLAVGAVNQVGVLTAFSSIGPSADNRIKPDLVAMGQGTILLSPTGSITSNNGTSFAAPLVAGLAAGVWQAFPHLTNMELLELLKNSGSQASNPDNELGYGIPSFKTIIENSPLGLNEPKDDLEQLMVYPNPNSGVIQLDLPEKVLGKEMNLVLTSIEGKEIYKSRTFPNEALYQIKISEGLKLKGLHLLKVQYHTISKVFKIYFK